MLLRLLLEELKLEFRLKVGVKSSRGGTSPKKFVSLILLLFTDCEEALRCEVGSETTVIFCFVESSNRVEVELKCFLKSKVLRL